MCLKQISLENKDKEDEIQRHIFSLIDDNQSLIFNSGAGSGKTYALIESLKYIINEYGKLLKSQNQKIVCITYTNVATTEVQSRLGSSDLVVVSTIHTRIWDIIKRYKKKELLQIHKEKLEKEIEKLEATLVSEKCKEYRDLSTVERDQFASLMNEYGELYYNVRNQTAAQIRSEFNAILTSFSDVNGGANLYKKGA